MNNNTFNKECSYLLYLVKNMSKEYTNKQISKTTIQKLMYLLERNGLGEYNYSLYHFGPYSYIISECISSLSKQGLIKMDWRDSQGYFIYPAKEIEDISLDLNDTEKKKIEKIIKDYGNNNAIELSLIATSLYIMNNYDVSENSLVEEVHQLKPTHTKPQIQNILQKAGIYY